MRSRDKQLAVAGSVIAVLLVLGGAIWVFSGSGSAEQKRDQAMTDRAYRAKSLSELENMKIMAEQVLVTGHLEGDVERRQKQQIVTLERLIAEKRAATGG